MKTPEPATTSFAEQCESKANFLKAYQSFDANRTGAWLIRGGDQSGSYSTSHCPILAVVIGTAQAALDVAVTLKFWTYWSNTGFGSIDEIPCVVMKSLDY